MSDDAFLCWSCLRPYHQELLPILNQQIDKLIKLTEWRICDDNIVMTIIYILKSYALVSLRIISAYTDRTYPALICLIQEIVYELTIQPIAAALTPKKLSRAGIDRLRALDINVVMNEVIIAEASTFLSPITNDFPAAKCRYILTKCISFPCALRSFTTSRVFMKTVAVLSQGWMPMILFS